MKISELCFDRAMSILLDWKSDDDLVLICLWVVKNYLSTGPKRKIKIQSAIEKFEGEALKLIKACLMSKDYRHYTPAARCISDISQGSNCDVEKILSDELIGVSIF